MVCFSVFLFRMYVLQTSKSSSECGYLLECIYSFINVQTLKKKKVHNSKSYFLKCKNLFQRSILIYVHLLNFKSYLKELFNLHLKNFKNEVKMACFRLGNRKVRKMVSSFLFQKFSRKANCIHRFLIFIKFLAIILRPSFFPASKVDGKAAGRMT